MSKWIWRILECALKRIFKAKYLRVHGLNGTQKVFASTHWFGYDELYIQELATGRLISMHLMATDAAQNCSTEPTVHTNLLIHYTYTRYPKCRLGSKGSGGRGGFLACCHGRWFDLIGHIDHACRCPSIQWVAGHGVDAAGLDGVDLGEQHAQHLLPARPHENDSKRAD